MDIFERFAQIAKTNPKKVVFPDAADERVIKAARYLYDEKLAFPVLIGSQFEIRDIAAKANTSTTGLKIVSPRHHERFNHYVKEYYNLRKHKGMVLFNAEEIIQQPLFFGAMLLHDNQAQICIAGNQSKTADVLRAAIQIIGIEEGIKTVSSFFLMIAPEKDRVYAFADCAVIPDPGEEQLAEIAVLTSRNYERLISEKAKTALLSFSTKGSARHPRVDKIQRALELVKTANPGMDIDGEIQFDAAVVPEVAQKKVPDSPIGGNANVFIFPSLEAGNIGYKIAERFGKFTAVGPLLQGLKHPMHDLSRGCSIEDIIKVSLVSSVMIN